jgi:hypothetical protein
VSLGYQGNADWRDMSDYLVHFVGGRDATEQQRYDLVKTIVAERKLLAGPLAFGFAKGWTSPVPLTFLPRLVSRHGGFGVGLTKSHARASGGQRVWYVDDGTEVMSTLDALVAAATEARLWNDDLWKITRFIDRVTPDGDGRPRYEFDWEREWRVPGEIGLPVVPFLFIPESWQARARGELAPFRLIDPHWDESRIEAALR